MGHGDDARTVLVEKERRQRAARRARAAKGNLPCSLAARLMGRVSHWATVGYGRQPLRPFRRLFGLWLRRAGSLLGRGIATARHPWLMNAECRVEGAGAGAPGAPGSFAWTARGRPLSRHSADGSTIHHSSRSSIRAETLLPVVNLEQRAHWLARPGAGRGAGVVDAGVSLGAHAGRVGAGAAGDRGVLGAGEVGIDAVPGRQSSHRRMTAACLRAPLPASGWICYAKRCAPVRGAGTAGGWNDEIGSAGGADGAPWSLQPARGRRRHRRRRCSPPPRRRARRGAAEVAGALMPAR